MTALFDTPVVFIIFNRPSTTRAVFHVIRAIRPSRLLIIADGPRTEREGEAERCQEVREIATQVSWPCEVFTNFAPINLGCRHRIVTGLDWAFSIVEEAIILEDDCLPDLSFFPFCQELLERYRGDARIAAIAGTNLVEDRLTTTDSYYFSQLGGIWGWATWSVQWQGYDRDLLLWPEFRRSGALSEIFDRVSDITRWTEIFDKLYAGRGPNTWDYQWIYTNLFGHRLTIVPRVNLIANLGFGPEATHTSTAEQRNMPTLKNLEFPIKHPSGIVPSRTLDRYFQDGYSISYFRRVARKAVGFFGRLKRT